jgi:ornithine cyclodeaminase/alanine dehydrogenase-like protein (mu-crystallin family)
MLILKERDVFGLLSNLTVPECRRLLDSLHNMLREYSRTKHASPSDRTIHQPERDVIVTKLGNTTLFMPSSVTTSTGIKVVTISPTGGLKGAINLFSPDGTLLGVLNAEEVTAFRTSLAVMIPFVRYPHPKTNMLVFGAGRQAEWHIKLALLLGEAEGEGAGAVKHVTVVNRTAPRGRMEQLFATLRRKYPDVTLDFLLKTDAEYDAKLQNAIKASDMICGCTPSTVPHFPARYLDHKPRYISLIGSYKPEMQEVDAETLLSGEYIYVDTEKGCLSEAGELIKANVQDHQLIELGELLGDKPFALDGNLVFKCVGLGIMDTVMAGELLRIAQEKGVGLVVDDF